MSKPKNKSFVIIGNSVAAIGGVEGIRSVDQETPITLISREPEHTYSRPLISYLLGGEVDESRMYYRDLDYYERNNVTPMLGVEAVGIDTENRCVKTADGQCFPFDKLLIATGGRPFLPPGLQGTDAKGVFTFTEWRDARAIKEFIEKRNVKTAVVVGGGLIGLKSVEALMALGVKTTIVELADRILSITFDHTASEIAQHLLRKEGVDICCETTVAEIFVHEGTVTGVQLKNGARATCDLLLFAIGVVPNVGVVQNSPIQIDRGIVVDDYMETNVRGIYAAGDVAQATNLLTGEKRPIPIFPNAYRQGFVAGMNMAGEKKVFRGGIPMNSVAICGLPTISVGETNPPEGSPDYEILTYHDEQRSIYKKIVLKRDVIVGAIFVGKIDRAGIYTGLIKQKINVKSFKDVLLTDDFGLLSLPANYRKHVVSGTGIEV